MDVTREVTFTSSNTSIVATDPVRPFAYAVAASATPATISLLNVASNLMVAGTAEISVSDSAVIVTDLTGVAVGSASVSNVPSEVVGADDETFTAFGSLLQGLSKEGDSAFVFAYATFSDGAIMEVDASMGLQATSLKTTSVVVATSCAPLAPHEAKVAST